MKAFVLNLFVLIVMCFCGCADSEQKSRDPLEEKCHEMEIEINDLKGQRWLILLGCVGSCALCYLLGLARGLKVRDDADRQNIERCK